MFKKRRNILDECYVMYTTVYGTKEYINPIRENVFIIYTVSHMLEYLEDKLQKLELHPISSKNHEYGTMIVSLTKKMGQIPMQFKRKKEK